MNQKLLVIFLQPLAMLALAITFTEQVEAQEKLLPSNMPIEKVIDHYIEASWKEKKIKPADAATDTAWIRRISLDLNGRIPTPSEAKTFAEDKDPTKKQKAIDRLIASPLHLRHQAREIETLLMNGTKGNLSEYLTKALNENRTWDRIFKDFILADETDVANKGSSEFLKNRVKDLDKLTNDVSIAFFGVNVSCAQCHDHPLVHDWKQDHFYGMKSFFSRTYEVGNFLAEKEYGVVKFLPNKGKEKQADYMFLTGKTVKPVGMTEPTKDELKKEKEMVEEWKKNKTQPTKPKTSTRAMLVEIALGKSERDFFAKAFVNQLWHRFYGFGLVMPLDQMHSENPPSHPELMNWLAQDFASNNFNIPRLVKGLVSSKVYGLSSRYEGASTPLAKDFAVARLKPLTPMQMGVSLRLAGNNFGGGATSNADLEKKLDNIDNGAKGLADQFVQPSEDFQIGVTEALFFSNSTKFQSECLPEGKDKLVTTMTTMETPEEQADLAVWSVLGRPATSDEKAVIAGYIKKHGANAQDASKQVVWSLMASPEFRFNH